MCGICGILRCGDDSEPIKEDLVSRMTDTMAHRGPNDRGVWIDREIALGSRRLSVIDLSSAGHQPMANEDGSVQLVLNGEIYNFRELKQQFRLVERGHVFRSRTDTEVLVHLYEEVGLDLVRHLNGMFGIAIWDARKSQLHLMRDRYGIKPLFYHRDERRFRFGSEIKAILADPAVPRRPSFQALYDYLTFDYIPGAQTAFADIWELPPAHCMSVSPDGASRTWRYWDPSFDIDESLDEATASKTALGLMDRAVERQLVADVPVGVLLSGGLDSSTITALMARRQTGAIHTYSVGFEDRSYSELPYARIVAEKFHTTHREVTVTPQRVRELLPIYLRYIDEPYADGSAIPTYCVCELAKGEVVVVLSGEGGDEAFAGYETHAAYKASRWFGRLPGWLRHQAIGPLVNRLPVSHKKLSLEFKMKRFLGGQDLPVPDAHLWWRIVLTEAQKRAVLADAVLKQCADQPPVRHFREVFARSSARDDLNRILHIDSAVFLPDDLMVKNDRMSMAHSLEARVPLTDNDLTEFCARIPPRLKLRGLRKKNIMRRAVEPILPRSIVDKKKVGLEMPYSRWLTDELKDVMLEYLDPSRVAATGLFKADGVSALVQEHLDRRFDHGRALWGLLNYMIWLGLYIPGH